MEQTRGRILSQNYYFVTANPQPSHREVRNPFNSCEENVLIMCSFPSSRLFSFVITFLKQRLVLSKGAINMGRPFKCFTVTVLNWSQKAIISSCSPSVSYVSGTLHSPVATEADLDTRLNRRRCCWLLVHWLNMLQRWDYLWAWKMQWRNHVQLGMCHINRPSCCKCTWEL